MTKIPLPSLAKLLHAFFHDWLVEPELCTQTPWIRGSRSRRSGVIAR